MAVREELLLDLSRAIAQIDDLERELDALLQPIRIPVEIESDQAIRNLRDDISRADADSIDIDVNTGELSQAESEIAELQAEIAEAVDDSERFARSMDRAGDEAEGLGRRGRTAFAGIGTSLTTLFGAVAAFQGFRILGGFFADSIEAATDTEEALSKARVVFGDFSDEIEQFAATAPEALGLANREALAFTGTFGNLFVAMGLTQQAAADLAPDIVELGSDLASFNNIETADALEKLRAGLVGEAEPLRTLGVNLNAAATAAKAVELGLAGSTGEVSEAAKVQARYAIILEQTATAQGDFARTAEGVANRQRTLAAQFDDLRAAVGEAVLPAFESLLDVAPQLVDALETGLVPAIKAVASAFADTDASGFVDVLARLPVNAANIAGNLGSAAEAAGNFQTALLNLFSGNIGGAVDQLAQGIDDINDIRLNNTVNKAIESLIVTMQSGVDPAQALESALLSLDDADIPIDVLDDLAERLITISGVTETADLARLGTLFGELGQAAGFNADEIEIFQQALFGAARGAEDAAPPLNELVEGVSNVGTAVEGPTRLLSGFGDEVQRLSTFDVPDLFAALEEEFTSLPDSLDLAAQALRDAEGEMITDVEAFLANLERVFSAQLLFESNIEAARALGLDHLVEAAQTIGEDFAPVLADALTSPGAAAELDSRLAGFMDERVRNLDQALTTELLQQFGGREFNIPIDVAVQFENIRLPGAGNLLENIQVGTQNVVAPAPSGGGTTIIFQDTPEPTTDTARIVQTVNNINGTLR